jgi:predicted PurR-regulated permease PerM
MSLIARKIHNGRTTEELIALLSAVASAILAALFIAALYFGREIFVPIALAILLSFVLAPLVGLLQRARIPRGFSVVSVVVLAFMIIFGLGTLIANQLSELAGDLPVYQSTMREKIKSVRGATARSGTLERAVAPSTVWAAQIQRGR